MISIFGSGFGVYGYLPVVLNRYKKNILLLSSYRDKVFQRSFGNEIKDRVLWIESKNTILKSVETIIIAMNPGSQEKMLEECLAHDGISSLILEKPLASNPSASTHLLSRLINSEKSFRIGYTFLYTSWLETLKVGIKKNDCKKANLTWLFKAHHNQSEINTWKRNHSKGGGVLRFYGIHVISVMALLGYDEIKRSEVYFNNEDELLVWSCSFAGHQLPCFDILVDSNSSSSLFNIFLETEHHKRSVASLNDPFDLDIPRDGLMDRRVSVVDELFESFAASNDLYCKLYKSINDLWLNVESNTIFKKNE